MVKLVYVGPETSPELISTVKDCLVSMPCL